MFPLKNIQKAAWSKHPNGISVSQIDHLLIDDRHSAGIMDVRSLRRLNVGSNHYLVRAKIRHQISVQDSGVKPTTWFDVKNLHEE